MAASASIMATLCETLHRSAGRGNAVSRMGWPDVATCLVIDVALRQGPCVAAQVAHALPGQEGGPAEVLLQILSGDVKLPPHLLPDVLLPCSGQTAVQNTALVIENTG